MADQLQIRDTRNGNWSWFDNDLIVRDGKQLGPYGLAVYMALCALARNNPELTYTESYIGEVAGGVSRTKTREMLKLLVSLGWVEKQTHVTKAGERTASTFRLLSNPHREAKPASIPADIVHNDEPADPPADTPPAPGETPDIPRESEPDRPTVTTVVNIHKVAGKRPPYDVYIGRRCQELPASEWGNPFRSEEFKGDTLPKYREYLTQYRPDLLKKIPDLVGKRLGCWCKNTGETGKLCHGDILADLANQYQAGEWQPPDTSAWTAVEAPALFTLSEIKTMKFKKSEWTLLRDNEQKGRNRRSVIAFCEAKLAAHPLEPRFEEMMAAVDLCTTQSRNDPGMTEIFAKVIRGKLWSSHAKGDYYTPEELIEFSKTNARVSSVHFLPGALSTWRQDKRGNGNGRSASAGTGVQNGAAGGEGWDDVLRKLGRTQMPRIYGGETAVSEVSGPGDIPGHTAGSS